MTDQERVPILLTREQAEVLLPHALWQVQREEVLCADPEMPESMFDASLIRWKMWESIVAQLREKTDEQ